jgi:hypothetical protein
MESSAAAAWPWKAEDQLFAFTLMGDAQRLTSLDDLWTSLLATPTAEGQPPADLPLLQAMVGELVGSLASVTAAGERLELLTERATAMGIDLDSELADVLGRSNSPIVAEISPPSPFASAVHEACQVLREETPREIAEITAKLLRISEGGYELGDWGLKVKKALLIVAAAAGVLVAVSVPGAIVIPVALSAGAGVVSVVSATLVAWDSLPSE